MLALDHRAEKVKSDFERGAALEDYSKPMLAFRDFLENKPVSREAEIAFGMRDSLMQREIIEALILSDCPAEEIESSFNVPAESVDIYKDLFFDASVFRTGLDRLEYLENYPDPSGRDLKLKAVSLGYEFVLFNFANLVPKTISQKKLVERMFMATAYKAMAMNYNNISSSANKQAIRHAELMIRAYELLNKINDGDGQADYDLISLLVVDDPFGKPQKPRGEEII